MLYPQIAELEQAYLTGWKSIVFNSKNKKFPSIDDKKYNPEIPLQNTTWLKFCMMHDLDKYTSEAKTVIDEIWLLSWWI